MSLYITYSKLGKFLKRRLFFQASTALEQGQGVSYDKDYGTNTDDDVRRDTYCELPKITDYQEFAGVAIRKFRAKSGGQWIDIGTPGGLAYVAALVNTTINTSYLTFTRSATASLSGYFVRQGLPGKGTAEILETNASVARDTQLSGADYVTGATLTDASGTALGDAITDGDRCFIFGGAESDSDDGTAVTEGVYVCTATAVNTTVTLASSPGADDSHANYVAHSIVPATTVVVLAKLQDGVDSGGYQFLTAYDNATPTLTAEGWTGVCGGWNNNSTDATATLADHVRNGTKKAIEGLGAIATQEFAVTISNGLKRDGSTGYTTIKFNAAAEIAILEWWYDEWTTLHVKGAAVA